MRRVALTILMALVCTAGLVSSGDDRARGAEKYDELIIGLIPEENIFKQMDRYRPLADYLSEKLGIRIRLTILSKYGDVIDRFTERKLGGAFFEDLTTVIAYEKLSVEPVATVINEDGTDQIRGLIIVRNDSEIKTVGDMKGRTIAFVDKASASGYVFPLVYFRERGVKDMGKYFKELFFTGSNDAAVYSVLDGRADIACVKDTVLKSMIKTDIMIKKEISVIAESPALPNITLSLSRDIPEHVRRKIRDILVDISHDEEGKKILRTFGAWGFRKSDIGDFSPVYNLLAKMGVKVLKYDYRVR